MLIIHANAFIEDCFIPNSRIRIQNGTIIEVSKALSPLPDEEIADVREDYILPGFVDVHTHAYGGQDVMQGEAAVRKMSAMYKKLGVSAFLPTTMSASIEETAFAVNGIRKVMLKPEANGAFVCGAHMEAPFLNVTKRGAQRSECFLSPSVSSFLALCSDYPEAVRMMTIAPELDGSDDLIRYLRSNGITVSAGHSSADAETLHHAAELGLNHCTHTFNAQPSLHHRAPGLTGASLADDRVYCEMIADGQHLHPDIVRIILAAKGAQRTVAITDSMEAAGMPDGGYSLGGQQVFVRNGRACLADGTLAGSVLTMKQAFINLLGWGVKKETAAAVCTSAPADSVGLSHFGRIRPGCCGILTRWTPEWKMTGVIG